MKQTKKSVRYQTEDMKLQAAGAYLRTLRSWHKLTQDDIAKALGVSSKQVSRWENGESDPSSTMLAAFCKLVHGSAIHLNALLTNPHVTELDGKNLAGQWLARSPSEVPDVVEVLAVALAGDQQRLDRWIGYGERLLEERGESLVSTGAGEGKFSN